MFRTRRQSIIRCGKMTTIRRFCCDDLLKFANVNIDHLTETVISPLLLCCLIDWGSFSLLLHFWTRDALRYWKALPCVYLRKHECSGNIIHRLAEDGACCVCGCVLSSAWRFIRPTWRDGRIIAIWRRRQTDPLWATVCEPDISLASLSLRQFCSLLYQSMASHHLIYV